VLTSANKYGSTTDTIKQRFTGYLKDEETSLDFAEARYYNNQHGRFTAVDPLLASGKDSNPQTFNRYIYVGNSPLVRTDPEGLEWYYNKSTNTYDWYDEKTKTFNGNGGGLTDDWKMVVGTSETPGSFVIGTDAGFITFNPNSPTWSEPFANREDAVKRFGGLFQCENCQELANKVVEGVETKGRTVRMVGYGAAAAGVCIGTAGAGCGPAVNLATTAIEAEKEDAENAAETDTVGTDMHGNSLASPKPTWVYELFTKDGDFLKNGITSKENPEQRYTKEYMEDKKMKNNQLYPNRRAARNVERHKNTVNPGPLNRRR
jgi:RHS repeat-associated protein